MVSAFRAISLVLARAALALACAAGLVAPAAAGRGEYPIRIEEVKGERHLELMVHNQGPATMTVYLTVAGENIASDVVWPITRAVRPFSSVSLGKVFPEDPKKPSKFGYGRSMQYGDHRAVHSLETHYRLPYRDGEAHRITQAYGDPLSTHIGHHAQHAIDFAMPEGTPIVATRDGVVIDVTLDYDTGGMYLDLRDKANAVAVQHEDGTVAHYGHLSKRSSPVTVGQRVTAGTVIGYAGNTGYSSGPHLHFAVTKPDVLADGRIAHVALPVKFYVDTWSLPFDPRRGVTVTAAYSEDSAMRAAKAQAGAGQSLAPEPVHASVIPVRAFRESVAGQSSAPIAETQAPLTVTSMPAREPASPPLQQVVVQEPTPRAQQPPARPVSQVPANVSADGGDHTLPGLIEIALILCGAGFALIIPAVFLRRLRT